MDYSLLLAIEKFNIEKINGRRNRLMNSTALHQVGAKPLTFDSGEEEVQVRDVGELMSRKHCIINGDRVYHLALIDFLQEWNS